MRADDSKLVSSTTAVSSPSIPSREPRVPTAAALHRVANPADVDRSGKHGHVSVRRPVRPYRETPAPLVRNDEPGAELLPRPTFEMAVERGRAGSLWCVGARVTVRTTATPFGAATRATAPPHDPKPCTTSAPIRLSRPRHLRDRAQRADHTREPERVRTHLSSSTMRP